MMNGREAPATETLTAAEVQSRWDQVLDAVQAGRKRVLVEQAGGVAIVSAQDLARLQQLDAQQAEDFSVLDASRAAFRDVPDEELKCEVERAVAQARADLARERADAAKRR